MLTLQNFKGGLYPLVADVSSPSQACIGFIFQEAARKDPTHALSEQSWRDANSQGCSYAEFSGTNTLVLRLHSLQLSITDIEPIQTV